MGVLLQAAYRRGRGKSVPSPADGNQETPWWWDHLADQAHALRLSGFPAVLLPPVLKTSAGTFPGADGYGPFDDYDLGSKDQFFAVPTRFGTRVQLQRCVAIMRANGLDVYVDVVAHQRNGGNNFEYRYRAAGGPNIGRFPKHKNCFFPHVPRDPIAGPVADDFGFGDELAPINAKPPGYVMHGLIDAGDWMTRALDIQGYRIDDLKGLAVQFVRTWLNSKAMVGKFAVGEYFDGNLHILSSWYWDSGIRPGFRQPFSAAAHRVTQTFEGADDLDVGPAVNGRTVTVGRIWVAARSVLDAAFRPDPTQEKPDTHLEVTTKDPAGSSSRSTGQESDPHPVDRGRPRAPPGGTPWRSPAPDYPRPAAARSP